MGEGNCAENILFVFSFVNEKEKLQSGVFVTMLQADFDSGCRLLVFNRMIVTVALRLVFSGHSSEPQTS